VNGMRAQSVLWAALESVADPEIPVLSVVDLGIVRYAHCEGEGTVRVGISPTYSGCPATEMIRSGVVRALRDAGFEVVYSGLKRTPEEIVREAIQEDVDVIGLSVLSGAHVLLARRVLAGLREQDAGDIAVVVGGIIPPRDVETLKGLGVRHVFPMGTPLPEIVKAFRQGDAKASK